MSGAAPDWDDLARRASAVIGSEEPLRLDFRAGRLFVDHAAPALLVHRCAVNATGAPHLDPHATCAAAHRLVTSQPAYLLATGGLDDQEGVRKLARAAADALAAQTGATLIVEVWAPLDEDDADDHDPFNRQPGFTLYEPRGGRGRWVADVLADALTAIEISGQGAEVARLTVDQIAPPGLPPVVDPDDRDIVLGLAVDPVFLNTREKEYYPGVMEDLRRALAPALERATAAFARQAGSAARPLGRRHVEPSAEAVDLGLAECERQYEFLLQVTPINGREAWEDFRASNYEVEPELLYRPFTFDPDTLLRELFALPVEAIEDPVVARLLREKRDAVAIEVQMILDRETSHFMPGSLRLYGAPDAELVELAGDILDKLMLDAPRKEATELVGATALAAEARAELDYYRARFAGFTSSVEVRKDIAASLMVSHGQFLVGDMVRVTAERVPALLAHEVGTHVLTYYNACAQPLRQLRYGLADYEPLQEGLAVLAEWLVGGLTHARMRTLAARVIAANALVDGADFIETFRLLVDWAGLRERAAFHVTLRIFRGGGLTKDMIYLRGLRDLLAHLGEGGEFWPLFIGKISLIHLAPLDVLRRRGVINDPPLRPRYVSDPNAMARLERARSGITVLDLF